MTIAIVAFAHCGTTMLAGICEILGIPMVGDHYTVSKWEDLEVIEILQSGDEQAWADLVAQRNEQHEAWGFKYPGAWQYLPLLQRTLRDPVYLAIWRDAQSVTRRRFGRSQRNWRGKLRNTIRQQRNSMEGIHKARVPVHHLSYLDAVLEPQRFIRHVARLVGKEPTEAEVAWIAQYIQPNRGKARAPYPEVEPWI